MDRRAFLQTGPFAAAAGAAMISACGGPGQLSPTSPVLRAIGRTDGDVNKEPMA